MRWIVIVLLSALLGCSTVTHEKLANLQPGVSTRADAEAVLGPPNSISDAGGDTQLLQWIDAKPLGGGHIAILFRRSDGRMVRVTHQHFTR